ncbi:MAG: hypothetical protein HY901_03260 [Deltaproteobacteria bacterium]|nr:hypothetical protein [Deltaproteobacteria bacterium]
MLLSPSMKSFESPTGMHAQLRPGDSADQTVGCRLFNATSCGKHSQPGVCAFAREDGICQAPPRGWKLQYAKLRVGAPVV